MSQTERQTAGAELSAALARHMGMGGDEVTVDFVVQVDWTGTLAASFDVCLRDPLACDSKSIDVFFADHITEDWIRSHNVRVGRLA